MGYELQVYIQCMGTLKAIGGILLITVCVSVVVFAMQHIHRRMGNKRDEILKKFNDKRKNQLVQA